MISVTPGIWSIPKRNVSNPALFCQPSGSKLTAIDIFLDILLQGTPHSFLARLGFEIFANGIGTTGIESFLQRISLPPKHVVSVVSESFALRLSVSGHTLNVGGLGLGCLTNRRCSTQTAVIRPQARGSCH